MCQHSFLKAILSARHKFKSDFLNDFFLKILFHFVCCSVCTAKIILNNSKLNTNRIKSFL